MDLFRRIIWQMITRLVLIGFILVILSFEIKPFPAVHTHVSPLEKINAGTKKPSFDPKFCFYGTQSENTILSYSYNWEAF